MDTGQVITFHFLRNDGRRERTKLDHYDLAEARALVEQVFRVGNGLYTEVDICTESGHIERIQNLHPTLADLQRI